MWPGRTRDQCAAGVRDRDVDAALVVGRRSAADEASVLEQAGLVGQTSAATNDAVGEVCHSLAAGWGVIKAREDLELDVAHDRVADAVSTPLDVILNLAPIAPAELTALAGVVRPGGLVLNTVPSACPTRYAGFEPCRFRPQRRRPARRASDAPSAARFVIAWSVRTVVWTSSRSNWLSSPTVGPAMYSRRLR
ncbi:MAG TPA: hypothetical protein VMJ65_10740 [Solirubrobacteraceae bacterium]|nr:hypothetical protein [Solirubrobacteraceae bacterium]